MNIFLEKTGFIFLVSLFVLSACEIEKEPSKTSKRFNLLSAQTSGIEFNNILEENDSINYFTYPYIYMGGGVAIGDLNNDNLPDIYLTGNMVKNKLYLNKGNMTFEDISIQSGTEGDSRWYTGATMIDINQDGYLDIYVNVSGKSGIKKNQLFINNGDLTFTEKAGDYGLDDGGQSIQTAFFDYDHDGDLDAYVLNYPITNFRTSNQGYRRMMEKKEEAKSDHFYRNDGNGTFTDVTVESGILNFGLSISGTVADYNNDGWDDIYISNDFSSPDYLYINNGDGTFTDKLKETTRQTSFYGMGADAADYNNDGLIDLVQVDMAAEVNRRIKANMASMNPELFWSTVNNGFHYQYMYNSLQLNQGIDSEGLPIFSNVAWLAGVSSTDWSWSPLMADFDNDGWKDLFISNGTRREINNRDYFKKVENEITKETPGDTLVEMAKKIPSEAIDNYMFRNNGDLTFEKVNEEWGIELKGFSNGTAYGDLDNDGDLDIVINNIDSESVIFENKSSQMENSHFLRIKFNGEPSNPYGFGNKVTVKSGGQKQFFHLNPSRGFQSFVEPVVHVGLGSSVMVDSLIVTWLNGESKLWTNVDADQVLTLSMDEGESLNNNGNKITPLMLAAEDTMDSVFWHYENHFDDFNIQVLLPHKMSNFGPALAVADINGDGRDDFFVGNGSGYAPALFVQGNDGKFTPAQGDWSSEADFEDMDAIFIDLDSDGDEDLYVVSGGYEFSGNIQKFQDRLYLNENGSFVKSEGILPELTTSGSRVIPQDFDQDGDIDLFVGGRLNPRDYPNPGTSHILVNQLKESGQLKFQNMTEALAPELKSIGMVTDGVWTDYNGDGAIDLVVVGEWMPVTIFIQEDGKFNNETEYFGMADTRGWWFSIDQGDFDQDGDMDLVVGNLGLNYKYQATSEETFDIYYYDFDDNGSNDIVLGYYNFGEQYPVRGRQCSSEQIATIQLKFKDYESFAGATIEDVYGKRELANALHYQIPSFSSIYLENEGNGKFNSSPLPLIAQTAPINDMVVRDFDEDGKLDVLIAGNLHASEVETPRADAGIGIVLKGDGQGNFKPMTYEESGIKLNYDTKQLKPAMVGGKYTIISASNMGPVQFHSRNPDFKLKNIALVD